MRRLPTAVCAALALAVSACGGGQTRGRAFDTAWADDGGVGIAEFQALLASSRIPEGANVAVGIIDARTIIGAPLDGSAVWTYAHPLESRPTVVGSVVVGEGGGEVFALDARSGKPLWARPTVGQLRGAGDDGRTTVVSLKTSTGDGSVLLAIDHDGSMVRQTEDTVAIGVPAVVGNYAFLPWSGHNVTVYDFVSGIEVARARIPAQTTAAFVEGGAVFFGDQAITRFDERIRFAARGGASTIVRPKLELPSEAPWLRTGTDVVPTAASEADKIRLLARPTSRGPLAIDGGHVAVTYYRIAVGFDVATGAIAWGHAAEGDILGGAAYVGGVALCDASGKVTLLDGKTGAVAGERSLGRRIDACVVHADALHLPLRAASAPLADQLAPLVKLIGSELVPMQRTLLRTLAPLPDDVVTKTLIDLAMASGTPQPLADDARSAIPKRRTGATHLLAALERHYDFLGDVLRPPPVGPIAEALAAMQDKRAAPLLAAHLADPADSPDDVRRVAAALAVLADTSQVPTLSAFFAMYRGAADDDAMASAVVDTARALVRLGSGDVVTRAATDPHTLEPIKARLTELMKPAHSVTSGARATHRAAKIAKD